MKTLKQIGLISAILLISQMIQQIFHLPIPGTVLGMLLLLALLIFKVVKLGWVENGANVLLDHLSFLFVPSGVAVIKILDIFKGKIMILLIVIFTATITVMVVTGLTVQFLINRKVNKGV